MLSALLASVCLAQDGPGLSRDVPEGPPQPFPVPLVDEPHCKAWQEFRRLLGERQWSLAFRAVADDLENPPDGLLPAESGFSREWRKQVHEDVGGLDTEGRRAFDLFFGGRARKLVDDARDARDPALATAFWAYGLTVAGTRAGDRIAAEALVSGNVSEAVEIWEWILKSGASAGHDPRKVRLGLCSAFARLGWTADFDRVAAALEARWGDDAVEEDGAQATVRERVARARAGLGTASRPTPGARLEIPEAPAIGWDWTPPQPAPDQTRMSHGWFRPGLSGAVRLSGMLRVIVDGTAIYSSDGKRIRAIETADGSIRWNRGHHWQNDQVLPNPWILAARDRLFVAEWGEGSTRSFSCRRAADGVELWMADLGREEDCLGPPLLAGDDGYVVVRERETQHVTLYALDLSDGTKRWTLDLGTPISATGRVSPFFQPEVQAFFAPEVKLVKSNTGIVLITETGLALAVDRARRKVTWAARLASSAGMGSGGLHVDQEGSLAYATFLGGWELVALDVDRAKVAWKRVVDDDAQLAAMDDERFYVLGDELCAHARRDRKLLWSRPLLGSVSRIVSTRDHLYVVFANGLHELSKKDGDDVRVLRGDHSFFRGGGLWPTPAGLLCVGAEKLSLLRMGGPETRRATTLPESKEGL